MHLLSDRFLQWIDGEVNVQVKLQLLYGRVPVTDVRRHVFCPQLEESLYLAIIKRAEQIFLQMQTMLKTAPLVHVGFLSKNGVSND